VDDPGKLYRQRRRATQAKGLETLDPKAEVEGPSESPRESPPPSPKEYQPRTPPVGEQSQPERKIELCNPDVVDLPIINLKRMMEKMEILREVQDLKAAEARSTREECEKYDHVQGKPQFNASSSI
jgi:hypothetical protein